VAFLFLTFESGSVASQYSEMSGAHRFVLLPLSVSNADFGAELGFTLSNSTDAVRALGAVIHKFAAHSTKCCEYSIPSWHG
jgi:hypothetical protein